jgi:hypothetical protein
MVNVLETSSNQRRGTVGGMLAGGLLGGLISSGLSVVGDLVNGWREGNIREHIDEKLKLREKGEHVKFTATEAAYMAAAAKETQKAFAEETKAAVLAAHYAKMSGQAGKVEDSAYKFFGSTKVAADGTVTYPDSATVKKLEYVVDDKGQRVAKLDAQGKPIQENGQPVYQTRMVAAPNPNIPAITGMTRDERQALKDVDRGEERENEGVLSKILRSIGDAFGGMFGGGSRSSGKTSDAGGLFKGGDSSVASLASSGEALALVMGSGNSTIKGGASTAVADLGHLAPSSQVVAFAEKAVSSHMV